MPLSNSAEHVTREAKDTHLIRNSTHIKNKLLCTPTPTIKGQLTAQQFNCYGHKIASKRLLMVPFPPLSLLIDCPTDHPSKSILLFLLFPPSPQTSLIPPNRHTDWLWTLSFCFFVSKSGTIVAVVGFFHFLTATYSDCWTKKATHSFAPQSTNQSVSSIAVQSLFST